MRLMPEMLVQERYWHELDKEAVQRQYGASLDGVRAYIEEHITDPHQQSAALAKLKAIRRLVPVAFLDLNSAECKAVTVRSNRAKGAHGAVKMSGLVRSLIDEDGWDRAQVALEIGATKDEIDLLY